MWGAETEWQRLGDVARGTAREGYVGLGGSRGRCAGLMAPLHSIPRHSL